MIRINVVDVVVSFTFDLIYHLFSECSFADVKALFMHWKYDLLSVFNHKLA